MILDFTRIQQELMSNGTVRVRDRIMKQHSILIKHGLASIDTEAQTFFSCLLTGFRVHFP
jgi:hypothetical protein